MRNENHQALSSSQQNGATYYTPNNKRKTTTSDDKPTPADVPSSATTNTNNSTTAIYGHINQVSEDEENLAESCPVNTATKLMMAPLCVSKKDRNKFCGSLPNHLDADDVCCGEENAGTYPPFSFTYTKTFFLFDFRIHP